jgi:hypothetical protein
MTRTERLALIEKLQLENDAAAIDMAQRKHQRELNGDFYDDLDRPPRLPQRVEKSNRGDDFNLQESIADQVYRQKRYVVEPPQQTTQPHTLDPATQKLWNDWVDQRINAAIVAHEGALIDECVSFVREENERLRDMVSTLKNEMVLLRAMLGGNKVTELPVKRILHG